MQQSITRFVVRAVFVLALLFGFNSFAFASFSDLNANGVADADESDVVASTSASLPAGEYFFHNLTITNNATIVAMGDQNSSSTFKGVKIVADNLSVAAGSSISANGQGYSMGPGYSPWNGATSPSSSYGSVGAANTASSTYGSAVKPVDLGSGLEGYRGGGAVSIVVAGTFVNDGTISANGGGYRSSGGSIYVNTNKFLGAGSFTASGAGYYWPYWGPGGGGRIAVHYASSSFSGSVVGAGTAAFFDVTNSDVYIKNSFRFQKNDEPLSFHNIYISNGAWVGVDSDVQLSADKLILSGGSYLSLSNGDILNIPEIILDGASTMVLSGGEKINTNTLSVLGGSKITGSTEKILSLDVANLTVSSGSSISANGQGYSTGPGYTPSNGTTEPSSSYGGVGAANTASSTYGSAVKPVDFGSGLSGYRGGGAVSIVVAGTFVNDGTISANGGGYRSSGGSVYVNANKLSGAGSFSASGASYYWPYPGPGGGGRIAVHYASSSFAGSAVGAGTAAFFDATNNDVYIKNSFRFQKNDEPLNYHNIYLTNGASVEIEKGATLTANSISLAGASHLAISDGAIINTPNITAIDSSSVSVGANVVMNVPSVTIGLGSKVTLQSEDPFTVDSLTLKDGGTLGIVAGKHLNLNVPNLTVSTGSSISAWTETVTGTPDNFFSNGEGASVYIKSSGKFINNGSVSANGPAGKIGGSIYVVANELEGSGAFSSAGGSMVWCGWNCGYIIPSGGRVAVYYATSSFAGVAVAPGACGSLDGWSSTCAGAGTIVMQQSAPQDASCTVDCYSNIMFLPGVMGTRLYSDQFSKLDCANVYPPINPDAPACQPSEQELWVSMNDDVLQERLKLDTNGKSVNSVYTKDDTQRDLSEFLGTTNEKGIVDDAYQSNIYESFASDLRTWKNTDKIIEDYAFIPYDWRLSLDDIITNGATSTPDKLSYTTSQNFSESYILKQLTALQKSSRTGKVTIVAHSNGGLVVKALIQKLKDSSNPRYNQLYNQIDKIIFVAVPQVGTPDAIAGLLHGKQVGDTVSVMSTARSRALAQNMPTMYNLLPTTDYYTYVDDPVITFEDKPGLASWRTKYGDVIHSQWALDNFLTDKLRVSLPTDGILNEPAQINNALLAQAEAVHLNLLDSWAPATTTKIIQVAGWGVETLSGIDYVFDDKLSLKPHKVVDGDGTVVVPSALWMATSTIGVERWWVNLSEYNKQALAISRDHSNILEVDSLRNFIKSEINGSVFIPDKFVVNNASTLTTTGERLHFTLHSPLTLGITDSSGRYTGLDPVTGEIKEEIPNTSYDQYGEVQFLSVPAGLQYTLKLKGYETGTFVLDVEKQIGNTVTESTTFQAIPTATSTAVTMDITPVFEVASSTLNIDQSGDGVADVSLEANPSGVTLYDLTAPTTTITPTGTLGSNGYYISSVIVTLSADDVAHLGEVSSGVASTKYSLDGGITWDTCSTSTPLVIATEGPTTLQYHSIDNNGNSETPKTLTLSIDTVAPTIFASDVSAEQLTPSGTNLVITATAEDNVDVNPQIISSVPLSQTFSPGTTEIALIATDMAGNTSTSTIIVTVFSSPEADPDGDCVVNNDDVNPFDPTVFANLIIPAEYSFWEKEKFTLPFSVAGKGMAKLSLSATYYKVSGNPIKDAQGVVVPSTTTEVDGIITISFPQNSKELTTYALELTTKKGNTRERDSIKKKRDNEGDEERRHELEKEFDFASAPIILLLQSLSCPNTTSQAATVNIYDKEQNAQVQYKYKDTGNLDFVMKSDDVIKIKKGQPLVLTVKVTGVKKNVQSDVSLLGNLATLSVIQEDEHHDSDDRKQKTFTIFYPLSTSITQENITVNLTVGGITKSAVLSVKFED